MAQSIKLKRSAIAGRVPTTTNLDLGELAINVRDGKLYFKRDDSTIQTILTTNSIINGDLTMVGDITGSDVYIDDWGSISGSLAAVQAGHFDPTDVETVYSTVHNTSGGTILKGTPLAVVAGQTSGNVSDVVPADAADPAFMPAAFIANEDILDGDEGEAIVFGRISGIDTSAFSSGDKAYVAPGGGWTTTKPVHPNKIQNLGIITKSHASNGGGVVMGAGRSNDVPNLTPGKVWVGTATYPTEATSIHLDEANGRLGINALTPGNRLTVHDASQNYPVRIGNNTANVDGSWTGIAFKNSTNTGGGSTYEDSAIRAYRYSSGHELELRVNDTSALRINGAGNVGIGTTSPSERLHVAGNIKLLDKLTFTEHSTNDYLLAESYALAVSGEQSVNFRVGGASIFNVYGTQIRPQADNAVDLGHTGFRWKTVRAAGNITTSTGSIGIGTQYPQYALEVEKDSTNTSMLTRITNTNVAGRAGVTFALPNNNNQMYSIGVDNDRSFKIGENNLGSNTRFVITAGGSIGIGTTAPTFRLESVANSSGQNLRLRSNSNNGGASIAFSNNDASEYWGGIGVGYITPGSSIATKLGFSATNYLGSAVTIATMTTTGLGIATSDVTHRFVVKNIYNNTSSIVQKNSSDSINFAVGNTGTNQDGILALYDGSSTATVSLNSNGNSYINGGNVGIGTTSPSHKLHVVNGSNTLFVTRDVGTAVRIGIGNANPSYAIDLGAYSDNAIGGIKYLRFYNGTDRLDVSGNGRFGFKASKGYFFYPTTAGPSGDIYGVAIRHLRDSVANANDDVLLVEQNDGTDLFKVKSSGNVEASGDIAATGAITSNGVDVLDNAVAMAIALG